MKRNIYLNTVGVDMLDGETHDLLHRKQKFKCGGYANNMPRGKKKNVKRDGYSNLMSNSPQFHSLYFNMFNLVLFLTS